MTVYSFVGTLSSWSMWMTVSSWVTTMPSFNKRSQRFKDYDSTSRIKAIPLIMWESASRSFKMVPMNLHNMP